MPFKKGQSGNPQGRRPGSGEIGKIRDAIGKAVPAILQKMAELAAAGDVQAAKVILERTVPSVKNLELPITLELPKEGTLTDKANAVLEAIADGNIAPGVGSQLIAALGQTARIAELDDIDRRLSRLENPQVDWTALIKPDLMQKSDDSNG